MPIAVSIIIVSFNARADLERCLESLHAAPPQASHEILVVDNSSTDGSAESARRCSGCPRDPAGHQRRLRAREQYRHPREHWNRIAAAQQRHHRAAGRDRSLLAALDAEPDVAIVGPRLVDGKRTRRTVVRPDDRPAERVEAEAARRGAPTSSRSRGNATTPTG